MLALSFFGREVTLQVGDHLIGGSTWTEGGLRTLEDGRQERRLTTFRATTQAYEAREILALSAQTVEHPRTQGRLLQNRRARVHQLGRRTVGRQIGVQRTDNTHVVRLLLELGEDFRNF